MNPDQVEETIAHIQRQFALGNFDAEPPFEDVTPVHGPVAGVAAQKPRDFRRSGGDRGRRKHRPNNNPLFTTNWLGGVVGA